jgi:hypothetical protein
MIEKIAQFNDLNDLDIGNFTFPISELPPIEVEDIIEVSEDDQPDEIVFILDKIPGAPNAQEIVVQPENEEVEVDADPEEDNSWKWTHATFLNWLKKMFDNVPSHSGHDTTGCEKAISYLDALNKEITKAMRTDYKNEIDSKKSELVREKIYEGTNNLIERLDKINNEKYKSYNKKSWEVTTGMIKEGQKSTRINGITITVPLLISRIARVCINSVVSAGHSLEDTFDAQVKEYDLTNREQAELSQLLADMGFAIQQDRGYPVGTHVDIRKTDNFDWSSQLRG